MDIRSQWPSFRAARSLLLRMFAAVFALALIVPGGQAAAGDPLHDWGRLQSLEAGRIVIVKPVEGAGGKRKGSLGRAGPESMTVRTAGGDVEIDKGDVGKVVLRRRGWNKAVWIGAAAGFGFLALAAAGVGDLVQPGASLAFGGAGAGLGALGGLAARGIGQNKLVYRASKPD